MEKNEVKMTIGQSRINKKAYDFIRSHIDMDPHALMHMMLHEIGIAPPVNLIRDVIELRRECEEISSLEQNGYSFETGV